MLTPNRGQIVRVGLYVQFDMKDLYTKLMLTIIAAALSAIAINGWGTSKEVNAQSRMTVEGMSELNRNVQNIGRKLDDFRLQGLKVRVQDRVEITQRATDSPIRVRQVN